MTDIVEWVKALGTLVGAVGLLLTYHQFRKATQWNKINATFLYLSDATIIERERKAAEALIDLKINLYHQRAELDPEIVEEICNNEHVFGEVKDFLNVFEGYAAALRVGALNHDLAYNLRAGRLMRYFEVFKPLIVRERKRMDNYKYWIDMEAIYVKWCKRREKEARDLAAKMISQGTRKGI